MVRGKKTNVLPEVPRALVRARAARDSVLRSVRNLYALSVEARTDVEKQQLFIARAESLEKYIGQFEEHQEAVLNALTDLDLVNEFDSVDAVIADEVEEKCGNIKVVVQLIKPVSNNIRYSNDTSHASIQSMILPRIEIPKFDDKKKHREMANHKNDDKSFITNVRLLKMTGLYQVLNPVKSEGSTTLWGCNIYQLAHILVTPLHVIIVIFCVIGFIAWTNDFNQRLNCCMLLVGAINTLLNAIRVGQKSDVFWKCFEIMRDDFLSYNYSKTDIVNDYKRKTVMITNIYSIAFCLILIIWLGNPVFITDFTVKNADGDLVTYRNSVINVLPYPFKVDLYNKLFPIIYIIEAVIFTQSVIGFIIFDSVLIIFCWSIIAHLKTIASAYSSLGYEKIENESVTLIEKFKTIISDHTKVISVMKDFFYTIRPIIVAQIGIAACILVCATYAYIASYFNGMPIMSATSMKYLSTAMFSVLRLFLLTKICGLVDNEVNSMNFSLYSCNWLDQDLSFQKLVLLSMTMNSVNMKTIMITPMKNVDLKIFTSVLHMAYSIISVLLKKKLSEQN